MTLVTIDAVVNIASHLRVREIRRVVVAVATSALEDGIVVGVDMTGRANAVRIAVGNWKLCVLRVVEGCSSPGCRGVTGLACGREELWLCRVHRTRRVVVIRLMATDTSCWERCVVVVNVAIDAGARRHGVRTGERERRIVVVKRSVGPDNRVVTDVAGGREPG